MSNTNAFLANSLLNFDCLYLKYSAWESIWLRNFPIRTHTDTHSHTRVVIGAHVFNKYFMVRHLFVFACNIELLCVCYRYCSFKNNTFLEAYLTADRLFAPNLLTVIKRYVHK